MRAFFFFHDRVLSKTKISASVLLIHRGTYVRGNRALFSRLLIREEYIVVVRSLLGFVYVITPIFADYNAISVVEEVIRRFARVFANNTCAANFKRIGFAVWTLMIVEYFEAKRRFHLLYFY